MNKIFHFELPVEVKIEARNILEAFSIFERDYEEIDNVIKVSISDVEENENEKDDEEL